MQLLDTKKIGQKIDRIAIEILENNYLEHDIIIIGINKNGDAFASLLEERIKERTNANVLKSNVGVSIKDDSIDIEMGLPLDSLDNKVVIIVDDVANTGRTIFYACKPLMNIRPKKVEVAVLIDRKHKSFPIKVDYVGLSLATTVNEHIEVRFDSEKSQSVHLIA